MDASDVGSANRQEIQSHGAAYREEGWQFAGWSAPMYGDPQIWAEQDVAAVHEFNFLGWGANWEAWGEGIYKARADAWIKEWVTLGSPCPLLLSCLSSQTPYYARDFNYDPFLEIGAAVGPQTYGDEHPAYTVYNMVETMKHGGVPEELLAPTFGATHDPVPYADYNTWTGARGAWIGGQIKNWSVL